MRHVSVLIALTLLSAIGKTPNEHVGTLRSCCYKNPRRTTPWQNRYPRSRSKTVISSVEQAKDTETSKSRERGLREQNKRQNVRLPRHSLRILPRHRYFNHFWNKFLCKMYSYLNIYVCILTPHKGTVTRSLKSLNVSNNEIYSLILAFQTRIFFP